ncbi:MAG: alpha/beta hydrolase-fold protein [Anaerolineae bacterium]|nr:alpha/beta hydrolase-fold protein [Anaerolineae bacterium]
MHTLILTSDGTCILHRYHLNRPDRDEPQTVDVWLPPGYDESAEAYPVLYMHDGQNLFDPALATIGVDWGMDEAVVRLMEAGVSRGLIVVGIWHGGRRWQDYMPQSFWDIAPPEVQELFRQRGGPPTSDGYLAALVTRIKPLIDERYRTRPDPAHTWLMGSSMGGLISLYGVERYPDVFGAAACVSTHWPAGGHALVDDLGAHLPRPGLHRFYFDYGTETLDADYEPYQRRMDEHLRAAGYRHGHDWLTRRFAGAEHSERAWRARVDIPLRFLLGQG